MLRAKASDSAADGAGRSRKLVLALLLALGFGCGQGCARLAARHILTYGSNGGGEPFPKTLKINPLFSEGCAVRVQRDPAIDLMVWIVEPRPIRVWDENDSPPLPDGSGDEARDITLSSKGNPTIHIRVAAPAAAAGEPDVREPVGTVVVLQGQGGCARTSEMFPVAAVLADAGYRVVMPDLRSQGDSTGERLGFLIDDVRDLGVVLDWLESRGLLAGRLGILGHSYGAAVAGYALLMEPRVETVVCSGMPACLREVVEFQGRRHWLWRLMPDGQRAKVFQLVAQAMGREAFTLDSRELISETSKPALLIHGEQDDMVPVRHAREIHRARPEGTELVVYEQWGHGDYFLADWEQCAALCRRWFDEKLPQKPARSR